MIVSHQMSPNSLSGAIARRNQRVPNALGAGANANRIQGAAGLTLSTAASYTLTPQSRTLYSRYDSYKSPVDCVYEKPSEDEETNDSEVISVPTEGFPRYNAVIDKLVRAYASESLSEEQIVSLVNELAYSLSASIHTEAFNRQERQQHMQDFLHTAKNIRQTDITEGSRASFLKAIRNLAEGSAFLQKSYYLTNHADRYQLTAFYSRDPETFERGTRLFGTMDERAEAFSVLSNDFFQSLRSIRDEISIALRQWSLVQTHQLDPERVEYLCT